MHIITEGSKKELTHFYRYLLRHFLYAWIQLGTKEKLLALEDLTF